MPKPHPVAQASTAAVPEDRRALIILLLILKRVYIYLVAISCVDIAARRSFAAAEGLGQRIQKLNDEILGKWAPLPAHSPLLCLASLVFHPLGKHAHEGR